MTGLLDPETGQSLRVDGPYTLTNGTRRWPVIDGIPFLRTNRDALVEAALTHVDAGRQDEALALLLADQDDWWNGPLPEPAAIRMLIENRDRLCLGEAMDLLQWGRVGDYFLHRWTDPTFLAGLSLTEAHWNQPGRAFELACGIGHHLRALTQQGVSVTGADIVFAKLWIARHWLVRDAALICFDAASYWPLMGHTFDLVTCHDAFYFLEPKADILEKLRAFSANGVLLVGHIHNREWPNLSAGSAMDASELHALAPDALVYDDDELTRALVEGRNPAGAPPELLRHVEAFALVIGGSSAHPVEGWLGLPRENCMLRRNPLYGAAASIAWPSDRYRDEYASRATYPLHSSLPMQMSREQAPIESIRRRELVDLPERWS